MAIIRKYINLAAKSRSLNDFNSVQAITAAMCSHRVTALLEAWNVHAE